MFWIWAESTVDNIDVILLALSNTCTASQTVLLVPLHQEGGWGAPDVGRGDSWHG